MTEETPGRFRLVPDGVEAVFDLDELRFLGDLPRLLGEVGSPESDPGAARLNPPVYLGDPESDAEWRRLAGTELDAARTADRSAFEQAIGAALSNGMDENADRGRVVLSIAEANAVLRVANEVRLVLGARWRIDTPEDYERLRPEASGVLTYTGWLVAELADVLGETLGSE